MNSLWGYIAAFSAILAGVLMLLGIAVVYGYLGAFFGYSGQSFVSYGVIAVVAAVLFYTLDSRS